MSLAHTPIEVFCSFAAEDARYLQQLEKHLNTLKRQGLISLWHRRQILPGIDWAKEIDSRLESTSLLLFLVSSDFLASDYLAGIEIQRAMEQQVANQARVLPILIRPVDWQGTPFAHQSPLPTNATPISTWRNRDAIPEALLIVGAKHLGPLLEEIEADPPLLDQAIESLRTFSLVQRDPRTHLLSVHRLVQIVLRDEMSEPETICWVDRIIKVVAAVVPTAKHESWPVWELLIGQIRTCIELMEHFQVTTFEAVTILAPTGQCLRERVRYEDNGLLPSMSATWEQNIPTPKPSKRTMPCFFT